MPETTPSGFSVQHVVGLVREAIPPMHPGGRPIVAGVAVAAGLFRAVTGRGTLPGLLATAATAAFFRAPRRVPPPLTGVVLAAADGTVATVGEVPPPAELDLPPTPAAARQRLPVGPRRARAAHPRGRPGAGRRVLAGRVPLRRPGQGQRGQRAQRRAARHRRRAARRGRADRGPAGAADRLRRRGGRRGGRGGDLRADPVRLAGRHLPAAGVPGRRRAGQRTIGGETVLATLPVGA